MAERKNISKKLRFEVFKRDGFTCQYCGRSAPDVILEVDHISPVTNGGKSNILNLITACQDCNRGKGARELSENEILNKQMEQLKDLNERREQLKMMLNWKKELENFNNEQAEKVEELFMEKTGCDFTDCGKDKVKKWVKEFGLLEVLECAEISISQYFNENHNETIEKAFNYIPKICFVRKKRKDDPLIEDQLYIRGILKNRLAYFNDAQYRQMTSGFNKEDYDVLREIALTCRNWTDFKLTVQDTFRGDNHGD